MNNDPFKKTIFPLLKFFNLKYEKAEEVFHLSKSDE